MEFRILGPLEVVRDGHALDVGGPKQRSVLAVLLINARRVVSAEKLADAVWDGAPPPAVATTLRSYISNLRKILDADVLVTKDRGYVIETTGDAIDALVFEDLTGRGRKALIEGDPQLATKLLDEALGLWRGSALEDFAYASFAQADAARLEDLRVSALEDLMEARLALGEHAELTSHLETLTSRHPLRERLWRSRMLALARSGRSGEALEAYEAARRHLADELGIDPSPELRRVHESVLKQSEDIEAQRPAPASAGAHIASFLFTDVERSTRMLQTLGEPERYAEVIEDQRRLLRDVFDARGARFVHCVGEEFLAVFDSATAAVRAALDGQLALLSHDWGDASDVRVRMGVHTGETTIVGGDYVGLSVHLASRIGDAGHGGQVLVSQASAELLDSQAIEPARLIEVGPHILKDFDHPVRLHQLVHPDLCREFPPLRTISALQHNLPARLTSFVGRTEDIAEVASLLEHSRLVTLTGVGGVGKTRLALEVAGAVLAHYPDGVWFCELAPVGDLDGVVQAVSRAIGLQRPLGPADPPRGLLLAALSQRRTLLVFDNCEHLLEPVTELIDEVLRAASGVAVLATSREGIGLRGEQILPVRSLPVPDRAAALSDSESATAIRLFTDRAHAVRPDFSLGTHNVDAVIDICRRVSGIPLAIELAAARTASMGALEIAARLDKAFRFLRSGDRTAVERHRTLRAAIDWSYELLAPEERCFFDRLGVFTGWFTLDAAERICAGELEIDVADALDGLVAKNLVDVDLSGDESKYGLLETLRQYASDKLADRGEEQKIRDAHCEYYLALVGQIESMFLGWNTISLALSNCRAAFEWALASGNVDWAARFVAAIGWFISNNMPSEAGEWAFRVIGLPGIESHELAPVCFGVAGLVAWGQSEFEPAKEHAERALALTQPRDPRRMVALSALAVVYAFEGRYEEAEKIIDEIVAMESDDPTTALLWRVNRALFAGYTGDRPRALEILEEVRPSVANYPLIRVTAAYVLAEVMDEELDPEGTIAAAIRAHEEAVSTNSVFVANAALLRAASVRGRHGDAVRSLQEFRNVIDAFRLGGNHSQQWLTLLNLAEVFARVGSEEAALIIVAANDANVGAARAHMEHGERLAAMLAEIGDRLGPKACDRARERGQQMPLSDLVTFAFEQIDETLSRSTTA